jgi:predicted MFS family arabinose efflux permease
MTQALASDNAPAASVRWYVLIVMCLAYALNIADRYVVTTVMEPMRLELRLSDSGIAFLTGIPLAVFYVTLGIPLSWLADRTNRRNILAAALVVWSGMTALCGLSQTYLQFLLARIGVGVGEAGGTPPANSILADYFQAHRRPMAMTAFALGAPLGAWLGADMAGAVANTYGWRAAFLVLGVPGVLLGVLVFLTIREPQRGRLDAVAPVQASFAQSIAFLWRQQACVHVIMGGAVSALWGWGLIWFTPTFLQRAYQLNVAEAGAILGPIHLVTGFAATLITGWLLSRRAFEDPRWVAWLLAGGVLLATLPSFVAYQTHDLGIAKLMLWLFVPALYFYVGPAMALVQNLAPAGMRATFIAISILAANVMNLIVAPQVVGALSDHFGGTAGPDAESLRLALLILTPTGLWAAYHFWAATRTIVADQARAIGDAAQTSSPNS